MAGCSRWLLLSEILGCGNTISLAAGVPSLVIILIVLMVFPSSALMLKGIETLLFSVHVGKNSYNDGE